MDGEGRGRAVRLIGLAGQRLLGSLEACAYSLFEDEYMQLEHYSFPLSAKL